MKQFILIALLILACMPSGFALSIEEARDIGTDFIAQNAMVGHKGVVIGDYTITALKAYQNEEGYRIIYRISSVAFNKQRLIMLEMSRTDGKIKKLYLSEEVHEEKILL